jgi:NADH-ubiquinone oxidoreductase chain 5
LAAIRKRAQIPFSTWLPIAIAAPTPVSALVHSSTLVTAGVYLMIRFNRFLLRRKINLILLFLSVLTIFMSGLIANVENDLKKIIALSTLRQLGLIIIILRVGMKIVAFYHLLTHAVFKSILFMCAGIIIHSMINNQDIRIFGNLNKVIPFTIIRFLISRLALCGFPFMAGFYSKDFIIEEMYILSINIFLIVIILVSLMFTVSYSMRVYYYMFFFNIKFYSYYNFKENKIINLSIIILVIIRIFVGSILRWVFFYDLYGTYLKIRVKILTLRGCLCGVIVGVVLILSNFMRKVYYLNFYVSSIWYLNYLYL